MSHFNSLFERLSLPTGDRYDLPSSEARFPDGAQYRVEIPSTEGPKALRAVVEAAKQYGVIVHRVSQGSGIMLMTDEEITEMLRIARGEGMEVSLFVGPRAQWDTGGQASSPAGRVIACNQRGMDQLRYALDDIKRGCDLGVRGVLIADLGLLWVVDEAKRAGQLPANLVIKTSVQLPAANPATVQVLERLGAGTLNLAVDLSLPQLAAMRGGTKLPFDLYIEAPDGFGGFIRYFELPEIVRLTSPVYVKLGLRNSPDIYPCGTHLEGTAIALSIERVRRARLAMDTLRRYAPQLKMSFPGAPDLAIPEI